MNSVRGIRTAFVGALLLAQFALPALHGLAFADESERTFAADSGRSIASSSGVAQPSPSHDPSACPICLASRLGRTGILRAPLNELAPSILAIAPVRDCTVAPPAAPGLDSASPRAPPVSPLVFA
jgi:hypothetical protein